jgi:tetratricopeptide (TPR) repeat protein
MTTSRDTTIRLPVSQTTETSQTLIYQFLSGIARVCFLSSMVTAPWLFGGVYSSVQYWLYATFVLSLAIWIPGAIWQSLTRGLETNRLSLIFLPLIGSVALIDFQLSPSVPVTSAEQIQADFEKSISKSTDEFQRRELGKASIIRSLQGGQSICLASTRFERSKLILVITVFFLATQLFATQNSQLILWAAFAVDGAALAFFGICQELSWNGKLYWTYPLKQGGFPFSSFVNRNNAAGYLCICLASALGLVIWAFSNSIESHKTATVPRYRRLSLSNCLSFIGELKAIQLFAISMVILTTTGIVLASSRGGWLALAVAITLTSLLCVNSRRLSFLVSLLGGCLAIVGLISWVGLGNRISKRWGEFASIDALAKDGRWGHWCDALNALSDFPVVGTGYGTYKFAYLPYQTHPGTSHLRFFNADNQFVEWIVEGGFVGISLILISILLTFGTVLSTLKIARLDAVGFVGTFALTSQCVSAFFDFGPTMPANMIALSAMFGSVAGRAGLLVGLKNRNSRSWTFSLPRLYPSVLIPILGIGILSVANLALQEVKVAARMHSLSRHLPALDSAEALNNASASQLIDNISAVMPDYPDDSEAHLALANLLIYRFRLQEFQIAQAADRQRKPAEIWAQTNPALYYRQVNLWERSGQLERIELLLEAESIQTNLRPACEQLQKAQSACALVPGAAQLSALIGFVNNAESRSGEEQLRRALVVDPANPQAYFEVGQIADFAGLTDFAYACWRTSLELDPRYLLEIHRKVSQTLPLAEELDQIIPKSGELLIRLARSLPENEGRPERQELSSRALALLEVPCVGEPDAERFQLMGVAYEIQEDFEKSIAEYRRALELSPFQIEWRLELTSLLLRHKGPAWALKEAEACAALAPGQKRVQDLVRELQLKVLP